MTGLYPRVQSDEVISQQEPLAVSTPDERVQVFIPDKQTTGEFRVTGF